MIKIKTLNIKRMKHKKTENSGKEFNCKRCGTMHGPRSCPTYGKECHFKKCYRTLRAHIVRDNESETISEVHFSIDNLKTDVVDNQTTVTNNEKWYKDLTINNVKVTFKIDTGANVNVLPLCYIDKNHQKEIKQSEIKLYAFGGTSIEALGKINLNCKIIKQ